jgi:hypothetical protein
MAKSRRLVLLFLTISFTLSFFFITRILSADQRRPYVMPEHGTLILTVPSAWKQNVSPPTDQIPTISFFPQKGDEFSVLIAPQWSQTKDQTFNQSEKIKNLIEVDLSSLQAQALDKKVDIHQFKGVYGDGYYFLLTDKDPKAGEYPYLFRAGIGVGDLLLSITVLSRSKESEGITSTIKLLKEARQVYDSN